LITGHEGAPQIVEAEQAFTKDLLLNRGARYLGPQIAEIWNAGRYRAEWLERGNARADQIADSIEVSVSWSNLMPLYESVMSKIAPKTSWSMAHLSHFYSTGSMFYFIFGIDDADSESLIRALQLGLEDGAGAGTGVRWNVHASSRGRHCEAGLFPARTRRSRGQNAPRNQARP
jgi:hypothetical protein